MSWPELYLSKPSITFPGQPVGNEEILARVRARFRGDPSTWRAIEAGIRYIFDRCNSKTRYLEDGAGSGPGELAAETARSCLERYGVDAATLDLVVYGGIAREYYEPATATEVAARLGVQAVHAFDLTCACAGVLEGLHSVAAQFALHDHLQTALICSAELTRDRVSFDVQSHADLEVRAAGLTLGNAAAAVLVSRQAFPGGSARVISLRQHTMPQHWALCSAPIDGVFTSRSKELFELGVHVAPELRRLLAGVGWAPADVDHFLFHQPSESMIATVLGALGAHASRAVLCHHRFGNTASTSPLVAYNERVSEGTMRPRDKLVFASAAAGFTMASVAAVWHV